MKLDKTFRKQLTGPILEITDPREHEPLDVLRSYFREILLIARKYARPTVEFEDLVVEGLMGLLDAIDRWDPERATGPNSFRNLAIVRIKSHMFEYFLANNSPYTIPNYIARAMVLVQQARNLIGSFEHTMDPTQALLEFTCEEFEKTAPKKVVEALKGVKQRIKKLSQNADRSYEVMVESVLKVERDLQEFEDSGECEVSPEEIAAQREFLEKFLVNLKPDAQEVILLLLEGQTLDQVGKEIGVTRERARQIKEETLRFFTKTRMFQGAIE